jgi:hypothetical protein
MSVIQEKAIVIKEKEKAELQVIEHSRVVADDEIFGRTLYTLISPGTELASDYCGDKFPKFPGYAAVARVESTGKSVTMFKKDSLFFCAGGHKVGIPEIIA